MNISNKVYFRSLYITIITLFYSSTILSQFSPEIIISNRAKGFSRIEQINDTLSVGVNSDGVWCFKNNHSQAVTYSKFPGSSNIINDIEIIDYDKDGDNDIWLIFGSPNYTATRYENVNGTFQNIETLSYSIGSAPKVLDYNEDGIDDYIFGNKIYVWNENTYEVKGQLPPSSTNTSNSIDAIDLNNDGYMDLLNRKAGNLFYYESDQNGGFTQQLVNDIQEPIRWVDVLNTPNGKMAIVYNSSNIVVKLEKSNNEFHYKQLHQQIYSLYGNKTFDVDNDGFDEIICNFLSSVSIGKYDHLLDRFVFTVSSLNFTLPNFDQVLIQEYNNQPFIVASANSIVRNFRIQNDLSLFQESTFLLGINTSPNLNFIDFDGDGFVDIGNLNNRYVMRYLGATKFGGVTELEFADGTGCFQDYDLDGDKDYIKENSWFENEGNLIFSDEKDLISNMLCDNTLDLEDFSASEIYSDFNGDGIDEKLYYEKSSNELILTSNTLLDFPFTGKNIIYLRSLDINLDGSNDIIFSTKEFAVILINKGQNNGFDNPIFIDEENYEIVNLEVVKMNNDQSYEVITSTHKLDAGNSWGYVRIHSFQNNELNLRYSRFGANSSGYHIGRTGDFNLDGIQDLMIYRRNELFYVIFDNNFNGSDYVISNNLIRGFNFKLKDLNSDGDLDVIAYCYDCQAPIPFEDDRFSYFLNNHILDSISTEENVCYIGDLILANQKDVDDYYSQYGDCTTVIGNLQIGEYIQNDWPDINNVNSLANIKHIEGNLTIDWVNKLDSLHGLRKLKSISGDFKILNYINGSLIGLDSLEYIYGDMEIFNLRTMFSSATNLPFQSLKGISGNISIHNYNRLMFSFPSWSNENFEGDIEFSTSSLSSGQFTNKIKTCNGSINIKFCSLASPIRNLLHLSEDLIISANDGNFDLYSIQDSLVIDGALIVRWNDDLTDCDIPAFCNHIDSGREVEIESNGELCELEDINCFEVVLPESQDTLKYPAEVKLTLWPQPSNDEMFTFYKYDNITEYRLKYKIYDSFGNFIQEEELTNNTSINVSDLANGLYIINVYPYESNANILTRKKFIVSH